MANPSDRISLDSNFIIDALGQINPWWSHIEPIIREAESGRLAFVVSVVAKAEVLTINKKAGEEILATIDNFFRQEYVHIYAVTERTANEAATIRRKCNLHTADAIHLATAVEHNIPILLTRDGEGRKPRAKKKLIQAHNLFDVEVITPKDYFDMLGDDSKQTLIDEESSESQGSDTDE